MPKTREPATERLSIRMNKDEIEKLRQYAEQQNMTITEVVREFIRRIETTI